MVAAADHRAPAPSPPPATCPLFYAVGAQPSDTVASLLKKAMIIEQ